MPLVSKAIQRALTDQEIDVKTQLAAATGMYEQLLGKAKQRMSVGARTEMTPHEQTKTRSSVR